jgi:sugar/nucleoside kinase (ribokinase family)
MNFWIEGKLAVLKKMLARIDLLVINEEEARQLAGAYNIVRVARVLRGMGPRTVVIKQGEYGALLFTDDEVFSAPAFPVDEVSDPTGAGDSFAGGLLGYIASEGKADPTTLRQAVIYGSAVASHVVEGVGVEELLGLRRAQIDERYRAFRRLAHFGGPE